LTLGAGSALARSKKKARKAAPQKQEQKEEVKKEVDAKISQDVIDALARGSLNEAAIELRELPSSAKSLYLMREVTRIVMHDNSKRRPKGTDPHQFYQNLGVANHNIFLFLKSNEITNEDYFENAVKFYKKARGYATPQHKHETDILTAAVLVSNGENDKAEKIMAKIDKSKLGADFQTEEYLATYYAAKGDSDPAIEALRAAHKERPDIITTWLAVGDDFHLIKNDARFQALLNEWHLAKTSKQLELGLPKPTEPKLQFSEPAVQFRHPTAPQAQPHYKITKKKAVLAKANSKTGKKSAIKKTTSKSAKTPAKKTTKKK
jgi:tetratricopeptide (TPR) repeat protein